MKAQSTRAIPTPAGRVLIVDDHTLFRRALAFALRTLEPRYEVREACGATELLTLVRDFSPGLVCLDLHLPGIDGHQALRMLRAVTPTPVLVLSGYLAPEAVPGLLADGAAGAAPKEAGLRDTLIAVATTIAGGTYVHPRLATSIRPGLERGFRQTAECLPPEPLSEREAEVLDLVTRGCPNREIARQLGMSTRSVERLKRAAAQKLGLASGRSLPAWLARQSVQEPSVYATAAA